MISAVLVLVSKIVSETGKDGFSKSTIENEEAPRKVSCNFAYLYQKSRLRQVRQTGAL